MRIYAVGFFIISLFFIVGQVAYAADASIKCSPATGTYKTGDTFTIDYMLDTRTASASGATVVATFDPSLIAPIATTSSPIVSSTAWSSPITNAIDATLGKITLDYSNAQPLYTGTTSIGQITMKAGSGGQAQFNFTFFQQYDDTTPGVVKVFGKKDGVNTTNILTDVNNCIYVIDGGATPTSAVPTPTIRVAPTATSIPAAPISELPRTGVVETTVMLLGIAGVCIAAGLIPSKFLEKQKK
jgi:hypothetical protein